MGTVPIYLSEISSPQHRGLIGGISGCGIAFGTMVCNLFLSFLPSSSSSEMSRDHLHTTQMSNWVGFACSYAPYGSTQWRLPLGLQVPWGIILFIGLATFMPDSPRQLLRIGKIEEARKQFVKIRSAELGVDGTAQEFGQMKAQIEYEVEREVKSYKEIFRLFRHRAFV